VKSLPNTLSPHLSKGNEAGADSCERKIQILFWPLGRISSKILTRASGRAFPAGVRDGTISTSARRTPGNQCALMVMALLIRFPLASTRTRRRGAKIRSLNALTRDGNHRSRIRRVRSGRNEQHCRSHNRGESHGTILPSWMRM